jgi:hypothetical protein
MSKIDNNLKENLDNALNDALSSYSMDTFKKKINDAYADIEMDIDYDLKERLKYNLSRFVVEMAQKSLNSILEGDEENLRLYLSCEPYGYSGRDREHSVIHGTLFETGAIELRKKIVDAYPQLLKNERILDLEDQVKSLVEQVNKEKSHAEETYRRYN